MLLVGCGEGDQQSPTRVATVFPTSSSIADSPGAPTQSASESITTALPVATLASTDGDDDYSGPKGDGTDRTRGTAPCDSDGPSMLSVSPLDPAVITGVVPMGKMSSSHVTPTDHMYIAHDKPGAYPPPYDVVAPADGIIREISMMGGHGRPTEDGQGTIEDYRMVIDHSCALYTIYIHLGGIPLQILEQVGDIDPNRGWYGSDRSDPVRVSAGQTIGTVGPRIFDFSLHDKNVTLEGFVVPGRYEAEEWKIHTVDPFEYLPEPVRTQLLEKNQRVASPLGGKIDYDIDGRLVGNWFLDGTDGYFNDVFPNAYWRAHLAIVYDHIDPEQIRVAIGDNDALDESHCSVCSSVYGVRNNGPDPSTISTKSGLIKYELLGRLHVDDLRMRTSNDASVFLGVFLVQMVDDRSIRMEIFPGRSAAEVNDFSENSAIYRR